MSIDALSPNRDQRVTEDKDTVLISSGKLGKHCLNATADLVADLLEDSDRPRAVSVYIGRTVSRVCASCVGLGEGENPKPVCVGHANFNLQTKEERAAGEHTVRVPSECPVLEDVDLISCALADLSIETVGESDETKLTELRETAARFTESVAAEGFREQQQLISSAASKFYSLKNTIAGVLGLNK